MRFQAKRESLAQLAGRYQTAGHAEQSVILSEFVAATGYTRKYAIRVLRRPPPLSAAITRPRASRYGPPVPVASRVAWETAGGICAKRVACGNLVWVRLKYEGLPGSPVPFGMLARHRGWQR